MFILSKTKKGNVIIREPKSNLLGVFLVEKDEVVFGKKLADYYKCWKLSQTLPVSKKVSGNSLEKAKETARKLALD